MLVKIVMTARHRSWSVADAKAQLSTVIECALTDGPQTITRYGKAAVVVVAAEQWSRRAPRKGNLAEFFSTSPLRGSGIDLDRRREPPRKLEL